MSDKIASAATVPLPIAPAAAPPWWQFIKYCNYIYDTDYFSSGVENIITIFLLCMLALQVSVKQIYPNFPDQYNVQKE